MAKPTRTFTGQEGQRSTGTAGPDAIRNDFDNAFAMFDPQKTLTTGEPGGISEENIRPGAATDDVIGERTVSQTTAPSGNTGKLTPLLSGIVNRIRAIMGTSNWYSNPPTTLQAAKAHIEDKNNPHGVTAEQIGAPTLEAVNDHINDTNNPHMVTAKQVGAITSVAGITNPGGGVDIVAGTGIAISKDSSNKRVTITATGDMAPGPHAETHKAGGSDPLSPADIGAAPATHTHSAAEIGAAPATHKHSAADITSGTISTSRLPSASTSAKGIVQLSTSTSSTSTTTAATPSAVKAAYDLAASKADASHTHSASDITSGTIAAARLPTASTGAVGIVKLTTSRTSSSTTLAVAASAMNAHRTSDDHDGRYYTKAQVDALVDNAGLKWIGPDMETTFASVTPKTGSAWETLDDWEAVASFTVTIPGTYLIYGTMRARNDDNPGEVAVCVPGWTHRELMPGNVTLSDVPPLGLGWASAVFQTSNSDSAVSFYLEMCVPAAPGGAIIVVARQSFVKNLSINGALSSPPPTRAWSRKN